MKINLEIEDTKKITSLSKKALESTPYMSQNGLKPNAVNVMLPIFKEGDYDGYTFIKVLVLHLDEDFSPESSTFGALSSINRPLYLPAQDMNRVNTLEDLDRVPLIKWNFDVTGLSRMDILIKVYNNNLGIVAVNDNEGDPITKTIFRPGFVNGIPQLKGGTNSRSYQYQSCEIKIDEILSSLDNGDELKKAIEENLNYLL